MRFLEYRSDAHSFSAVVDYPSVQHLQWFNHGFMKAEQRTDQLVLSDLRMGVEPDYTFRFAVAARRRRLARGPAATTAMARASEPQARRDVAADLAGPADRHFSQQSTASGECGENTSLKRQSAQVAVAA